MAVVAQTTLGLGNLLLLDNRFPNLDPAGEANLPTWMSVAGAFAGACAAFLHAVVFAERRLLYQSLAAALAFVSVDDFIRIHERLELVAVQSWGLSERTAEPLDIVLILPVLVAAVLARWQVARLCPPLPRRLVLAGVATLIASVALDEGVNAFLRTGTGPSNILVAIEEAAELAGLGLIATGLTAFLCYRIAERQRRDPPADGRSASRPEMPRGAPPGASPLGGEPFDRARTSTQLILTSGLTVAVVGVALLTLGHVVNETLIDGRFLQLNVRVEGNVPTWASAMATFVAAYAALLLWVAQLEHRGRHLALAALLAFFSLDDTIEIHELLGEQVNARVTHLPSFIGLRIWFVLYLPLLVIVLLLLWRTAQGTLPRPRRFVRVGALLLLAAVVLEAAGILTKRIEERGIAWPQTLRTVTEEGVELAAWVIVASGLTALAVLAMARPQAPADAPSH